MTKPSPAPSLSNHEWSAVAIALQDAARCGCAAATTDEPAGVVERLAKMIFGRTRPNGLADPRLEAVRRFVCATSRRRAPAADLAPALADHGFSGAQIDALALLSI